MGKEKRKEEKGSRFEVRGIRLVGEGECGCLIVLGRDSSSRPLKSPILLAEQQLFELLEFSPGVAYAE